MAMPSYDSFLYQKTKNYFIFVILIVLILITVISILFIIKSYDIHVVNGFIKCEDECIIKINVIPEQVNLLNNAEFIKINDKKYSYEILAISDIDIDYHRMINYQTLLLEIDLDKSIRQDNLVVDIHIHSNKEALMRKIIAKFIGKEE